MQIYYEFFISAMISSPKMTRDSNELKAIDQLISKMSSEAMKDVVILREISLRHKNEKLEKCASRQMS